MKKLKFFYAHCEIETFFDADNSILASWCCNDASWRHEYMDGLLWALGYEVENLYQDECDPKLEKVFRKKLKEFYGYDVLEES